MGERASWCDQDGMMWRPTGLNGAWYAPGSNTDTTRRAHSPPFYSDVNETTKSIVDFLKLITHEQCDKTTDIGRNPMDEP